MKTKKFFGNALLVLLFGSFSLAPLFAFADDVAAPTPAPITPSEFCSRFSEIETKILGDISTNEKSILDARAESEKLLTDTWNAEDATNVADRAKADADTATQFTVLDASATTDIQKKAVTDFKKSVTTAISAQRKVIDSAITLYRTNFTQAIGDRNAIVDSLLGTYKTSTKIAIEKAKASCAKDKSDKNVLKVRTIFKNSLKTIDDKLQSDKKNADKVETTIETLGDTKQKTISLAADTLKATVDKAGVTLKKILDTK